MPNDELTNIEQLDDVLQDYLDGLLIEGYFDSSAAVSNNTSQAFSSVDGIVADRQLLPNNVLPLPRFAETKPISLKLPLPTLKPVEPLVETELVKESVAPVIVAEVANDLREEHLTEDIETSSRFKPHHWLENGRPEWAQGRFECLMFRVGGLSLAVPLVELGSISLMTDELTPLFGQSDWYMGILPMSTGKKLHTVDTAKIVMPERYHEGMREAYRFVISIANMDWGLAVDDVSTAMTLSPTDVKWRTQRSKRPWLAGTLISQMCAVLDIQQLAFLLDQADKRR